MFRLLKADEIDVRIAQINAKGQACCIKMLVAT